MCTCLKNMEGYKLNDLKLKDFDSIQGMFDRAFKRKQKLMEIIPDEEEVAIDAIPLAVKSTNKDTYSTFAEDMEVQSCFLDDQLTNLSPLINCMQLDVLLHESRQPDVGIKSLLDAVRFNAAQVYVNTALMKLDSAYTHVGKQEVHLLLPSSKVHPFKLVKLDKIRVKTINSLANYQIWLPDIT
ncbi:hypothetical protein Tco_1134565 [Tanacetum coccineum]